MQEKLKLARAHKLFSYRALQRLLLKERQGFQGWDQGAFEAYQIPKRLEEKAKKVTLAGDRCNPKDLLDIANFAMFLYNKRTKKEE